jgi:Tfp pilus assembly protein PilO
MKSQRGPLLAAVGGAILVVVLIVTLVMPKMGHIKTTNDQLASAQAQQQSLQTQLTSLQATANNAKAIRTQMSVLDAAVPDDSHLSDLIRMLNDAADQAGVDFMTVTPGQPVAVTGGSSAPASTSSQTDTTSPESSPSPAEGEPAPITPAFGPTLPESISVIPMTMTVNGSYFAVDEYLFRLESLPRISKVTQLSLAMGPSGYPQLQLTFSVNFYTTDSSAGPGSEPGAQSGEAAQPVPGSSPAPTPSSSPSPTASQAG